MAGQLNLYNLGSLGVNVDKNPVQLEDGELTLAQNALHDPTGSMGGLRKRPGLLKINSSAVSGSVFGITNVPIDPITTRTFYVGVDQDVTAAHQWLTSVDAFGNVATATTPGACARPTDAFLTPIATSILSNRSTQSETLFIYPGDYTRGNPQPIRAYDGTVDTLLFEIPLNPKAVADYGLTDYAAKSGGLSAMILDGTKLYLATVDYFLSGTGAHSRVMEYDFETGVLKQIGESASGWDGDIGAASTGGATGAGAQAFQSLAMHQGYLYAGVGPIDTVSNSTAAGVYRIRPGIDSTWTYDFDNSGTIDDDEEIPTCMASYKGQLYVGMRDTNTANARLLVRDFAGAYTSSLTVGTAAGSGFFAMTVFADNLYVCAHDNNGASSISTIRKFDGTTWSTVKTIDTATATPRIGAAMVVHNSRLYVLAISSAKNGVITHTSDGTTWTDQSTSMTSGDVVSIFGVLTD